MPKKPYLTKQRAFLLDFFREQAGRCFTVEEIAAFAAEAEVAIGQTTIYRNLEKLAADGLLLKFAMPDGLGACFQAADAPDCPDGHFHLVCTGCGAVTHLTCGHLDDLSAHMQTDHRFDFDRKRTVFYGRCDNCKQT